MNRGDENAFLDIGKAVLNESLFLEYMLEHGLRVKNNKCKDFIIMGFKYGVAAEGKNKRKGKYKRIRPQELRKSYYDNGALVLWPTYDKSTGTVIKYDPIKYKMLMRSPGKAKKGKCIFINEKLYNVAQGYLTMDLFDKMEHEEARIVEMAAYSTLTTATAIDFITIPLDNILILEDEKVKTYTKAVSVKAHEVEHEKEVIDYDATESFLNEHGYTFYKKKIKENPSLQYIKKTLTGLAENGFEKDKLPHKIDTYTKVECYVDRSDKKTEVENTLWDGMGLIDDSIFPEKKGMEGFIYCRSHFFKSCLFRGDIQQYFKDYYGEKYESALIEDMFGNKLPVKDIKVIITDNSIKWLKFKDLMGDTPKEAYEYYKRFMEEHGNRFAIVKTGHKSKWGDMQRSSYQINNSLCCTDKQVLKSIASTSIDYCNLLKHDHNAFIQHLKVTSSKRYSINNVLIALDEWNDVFRYTQYFKNKKNTIISKFKTERLKLGKLLQYGDNLTICGNPIALLMKATGQDFMKEPCFKTIDNGIECCTTRFKEGERIAGFRSPHNSPNNIVHLINTYPDEIQKYFSKLGDTVVIINGIGTDVQFRLNGQDLDSDGIFATTHPDIVRIAEIAYTTYPTIKNDIPLEGKSIYSKNMESYAKMDSKIACSQFAIGFASNIAQLALSYYYDGGCKSQELEDVFIMCSVIAQVSIDSAKRTFVIDENDELNRIKNSPCMQREEGELYPKFYADIQKKLKNNSNIEEKDICNDMSCPMQILYDIIDEEIIDSRKTGNRKQLTYALSNVFEYHADKKRDSKQHKKIISIVQEYDKKISKLNVNDEDYSESVEVEFDECMGKIKKLKINKYTMSSLIAYAFSNNGDVCDRLLTVLFDKDKNLFLDCFKSSKDKPKTPDRIA